MFFFHRPGPGPSLGFNGPSKAFRQMRFLLALAHHVLYILAYALQGAMILLRLNPKPRRAGEGSKQGKDICLTRRMLWTSIGSHRGAVRVYLSVVFPMCQEFPIRYDIGRWLHRPSVYFSSLLRWWRWSIDGRVWARALSFSSPVRISLTP